jgi:hypothetical protein
MRWGRDVVAEYRAALIKNVRSLLTVTTHVTVVWMDVDLVVVQASNTLLDVAVTAIGIMTPSDGDAAIATVISTTTVVGDTIGEA